MNKPPANWRQITSSDYKWENDALEFLKEHLPTHEPYRAWANFEFIADDGSVNEVDALIATPKGVFVVEIKSHPGEISGDAGTWVWTREYNSKLKTSAMDNPMLLTDRKAKKLKSLLMKQYPRDKSVPFLKAIVFLSDADVKNKLSANARQNVYTRDNIREALIRLDDNSRKQLDRPASKALARAIDAAGIRESDRQRRVGMFELKKVLADSEQYQDWLAVHSEIGTERRIRIFPCKNKSPEQANLMQRAARREAQVLESIKHDGILQVLDYQQHELGPALIYEYDPAWKRLDQYLLANKEILPFAADEALYLVRAIANAMRYAHDKKLYHRGLSPHCIYLQDEQLSDTPRIKIGNWQSADREFHNSTRHLTAMGQTQLVVSEDAGAFTAPEAWSTNADEADAQHVDVFSLGALAYLLFSGEAPADSDIDLQDKLSTGRGLLVSDVMTGATEELQALIHDATHPDTGLRIDSISEFLGRLEHLEEELTRPENLVTSNPAAAKAGERLDGGIHIIQRLGQGATAVAFLVEIQGAEKKQQVLKLANSPDHNERLETEGEVIARLRHQFIVQHFETRTILGHTALVIAHARKGTLAQKLRKEGGFQLELLQRLGADLLEAVNHLEECAIAHRDIKPENIGLIEFGDNLHLMLFDFSLAGVSAEEYRAGTAAYLDPYISDKSRRRWDQYAERYAAALTLYEMTTGALPAWAQAGGLPTTDDTGTVEVDGSMFDPSIRTPLTDFFQRALARHTKDRHDNAELMLSAWRQALQPAPALQVAEQAATNKIELDQADLSTTIGLLNIPDQALETLSRLNINTVEEFLARPKNEYTFLTGVGTKTRKALSTAYLTLRNNLLDETDPAAQPVSTTGDLYSIDQLLRSIAPTPNKRTDPKRTAFIKAMLGHEQVDSERSRVEVHWPSLLKVRTEAGLNDATTSDLYKKVLTRWCDNKNITQLRHDIEALLQDHGNVMTVREIANALLLRRGSVRETPYREWYSQAVVRAAVEAELERQARWTLRRHEARIIVSSNKNDIGEQLADYATALGNIADTLAAEPLPPSSKQVERELQSVLPPSHDFALPAGRLLPLAVNCSQTAALSSRAECYPRGMPAEKALKLSRNALLGVAKLTEQEVHRRVQGRYPEAQQLPNHPKLGTLMRSLDLGFEWQAGSKGNPGSYQISTPTLGSSTFAGRAASSTHIPPVEADLGKDRFESMIRQTLQQGRFLSLSVRCKNWQHARDLLAKQYDLNVLNFDDALFNHLQQHLNSMSKPPQWRTILQADSAAEGSSDRSRLERLVRTILPAITQQILASKQPILLTQPGLLSRYGLITTWLAELRMTMAHENKPLLLLIATDADHSSAFIDGTAVPAGAGNAEYSRVPGAWLAA